MKIVLKKYLANQNKLWEEINFNAENTSFLSSIDWIFFQRELKQKTDQYFIYMLIDNREILIGNIFIQIFKRKIAKYAYTPYGPVISLRNISKEFEITDKMAFFREVFSQLSSFFKNYLKEKNLNLFRFDPLINEEFREILEELGYRKSFSPAQAIDVWEMPLVNAQQELMTEDELLATFKKDTRYYVNRARKAGVNIIKAENRNMVARFADLMMQTESRKGFSNHSKNYFIKQWEYLKPLGMTEVYLAKYKSHYISGALFNFYKGKAYYSHGASTSNYELSKLSSPYLLHFEIMKDAIKKGCNTYNFWGVIPKEVQDHYGRGFSDFKMKFPGKITSYVGPYEIGSNSLKFNLQRAADWWFYRKERY